MACRAILLVEAALGKSAQVMHSLRGLECVKSAERVTPPYDVIAIVEVNASEEVTQEIQRQLGIVDGITRMVVCSTQDPEPTQLPARPPVESLALSASRSL